MMHTFVGQQLGQLQGRLLGRLDDLCRNVPGWPTV